MDKILETIMNFINENTTLLIIICVFLIFVLIGYLIDNGIKTKRLEKQMKEDSSSVPKPEVIENPIEDKKEEVKVEEPKVEEIKIEEPVEEEPIVSKESIEEINEYNAPTMDVSEVTKELSNEVKLDPKINDMLLRDFSEKGISNVDTSEDESDISLNPINKIDNIDLPDISEPVIEEPKEPIIEEPKDPLYKNDKKLSDIFKKKEKREEPSVNVSSNRLENTVDFSNELDRILQKLNETNNDIKDSTLDETTDFTNMF